jgi:pyruvate kinase
MLESMINAPRPTRAEASDVANAVLDGSDCVMLSGESANGAYPLQAVGIMARICAEAERTIDYKRLYTDTRAFSPAPVPTAEAVAAAAVGTVIDCNIDLVIVLTDSGKLARLVSKYRPNCPILACSVSNPVIRQLNCTRGVIGYKMPSFQGTDQLLQLVIKTARDMGLCSSGHKVVTIHGTKEETPDESNIMKILDIE